MKARGYINSLKKVPGLYSVSNNVSCSPTTRSMQYRTYELASVHTSHDFYLFA